MRRQPEIEIMKYSFPQPEHKVLELCSETLAMAGEKEFMVNMVDWPSLCAALVGQSIHVNHEELYRYQWSIIRTVVRRMMD
jgi:hypothetical protein